MNINNEVSITKEMSRIGKDIMAITFTTQQGLNNYLKEHPKADKRNHRVLKSESKTKKEINTQKTLTPNVVINYLKEHKGMKSGLTVETKDLQRIETINKMANKTKSPFVTFKTLAERMANSIEGPQKAFRRGMAVLFLNDKNLSKKQKGDIASVFFKRAIALSDHK